MSITVIFHSLDYFMLINNFKPVSDANSMRNVNANDDSFLWLLDEYEIYH